MTNHLTIGSHGPLALTPHRLLETEAPKGKRKKRSKGKTEITTVFEYETRSNILHASRKMPTMAQSMRMSGTARQLRTASGGSAQAVGGYGRSQRRDVLRSDGGPTMGTDEPKGTLGLSIHHHARPTDQTMLLMHRLASQKPTKYLDVKETEASLASEASVIGAEDVLLPMLEVCGAVVRAPAAARRLILPPRATAPGGQRGGESGTSSGPARPTRSRRGSITLSTGY